jgi:phosphatidylserine/phosphatidylglycerophosphate/cardiolipin synthase-like enzyme
MSFESRVSTLESAADPRYQIAEEFDSEDVFVAAVPIEAADVTSAVAETAAAPEQAIALATGLIEQFRRQGGTGAFTVRRDDVADRLSALVRNPSLVEQGSLNLCGPAAFLRVWIDRDPVSFVRFAAELFEKGSAKLGSMEVEAGEDLRERDYYGSALPAMKKRAAPGADVAEYICPSADWMVMGALRDSANFFFDFEGMPDEDVSAATTPAEVADWLRASKLYSSVSDDGNWIFTQGLSHALGLRPGPGEDVVLLVNAHVLSGSTKKKSNDFISRAFPNHFIVLESPITQPTADTVRFDYWSWGERGTCTANKDVFNTNYYGAISARGARAATQGIAGALASPEQALIDSHTTLGNLHEEALGWDLLNRLPSNAAFVGRVLDALSYTDRDDVAYAIATKANDPQLQQIGADAAGRALLMRIVRELSGGFTARDEAREIERIVRLSSPGHHRLQEEAWSSSPAVVSALRANGLELQSIRAGWGERVYDEYAITVEQMPPGATPETFLRELSQDLNRTVNNRDFDTWNEWRRRSTAAPPQVGDLMDVDILGPINATVMFVDVQPQRFVFQTVRKGVTDSAPEWGAREFGFERNADGSVTFYTRGATTALMQAVAVGGGVPQEKSWTAWAKGVEAETNRRGGRTRPRSFHGWTTHTLERALFAEVFEARAEAQGGPSFFLSPDKTNDYFDYIQPPTQGTVTLLVNGRDSKGSAADVDLNEPLEQMEAAVKAAGRGDAVYLAGWVFDPLTRLLTGDYATNRTWGGLFTAKAKEGVTIRILMSDFDELAADFRSDAKRNSTNLDILIDSLPAAVRGNLAYHTSLHPAHTGVLKGIISSGSLRGGVTPGSHHQKLMVVRVGENRTAFCGGVDIAPSRTKLAWKNSIWHDLHVMLKGPIARDIEKEFVLRWNRETLEMFKPNTFKLQLPLPPALKSSDPDNRAELRKTQIQMLRTVSDNAWFDTPWGTRPFTTERDDIKRVYKNLVMGADDFLYFENQFFRSLDLADWIVERAKKNPKLKAIFVVLAKPSEGDDTLTRHGMYLQHEFFDRVTKAMGQRVGIYTMSNRMVHSKFGLADDARLIIGSANANGRSFELDSEIAVAIDDAGIARQWRVRTWDHALGSGGTVSSADALATWARIAAANAKLRVDQMTGEGVVPFNWRALPGEKSRLLDDALAQLDFDSPDAERASAGEPGVAIA